MLSTVKLVTVETVMSPASFFLIGLVCYCYHVCGFHWNAYFTFFVKLLMIFKLNKKYWVNLGHTFLNNH